MDLLINISGYTTNETPFESGCQITPAGDRIVQFYLVGKIWVLII